MIKCTVIKPFTTCRKEICLSGDVIYIEGVDIYFKHRFLGSLEEGDINDYVRIDEEWSA